MTAQDARNVNISDVNGGGEDPYSFYAQLRKECPVAKVRQGNGMDVYLVTRFEDAKEALCDARLAKDPRHGAAMLAASGVPLPKEGGAKLAGQMLASDPPEHTRLRRLVSKEFTVRRVERMREHIQALADQLADDLAGRLENGRGVVDLVADYAFPLPMAVIAELLGIPLADKDKFRAWSQAVLLPLGAPGKAEGAREFSGYLATLMEAKKADPGDDLFSALAVAAEDDRLSPDELIGTAILMIIAGHDTTVNLIANGMLALVRHPDQLKLLRDSPAMLPDAIDEFLRYDAPLERASARWAVEDMEIAGTFIPKGSFVSVVLGSANRDENVFGDGDRLDLTRQENHRHLAFGRGIHHCIGAPLAKLEGELAIGTLLRRFGSFELAVDPGELRWRQSIVMRSLESLPVRVSV
ncbi:cytochrome P450 [Nonomuraea polychroma]|uniref:Cytochrome P450 n=1 Tax=Nonomuraea polychroma TaxID=46176 RepID=A0A438LZQ6_9ACTN|nr:cytochrome P450 [Nonomuraea polychroma]RVX38763.1 cytochrome P450 [Nonomuraea polychroma]